MAVKMLSSRESKVVPCWYFALRRRWKGNQQASGASAKVDYTLMRVLYWDAGSPLGESDRSASRDERVLSPSLW